LELALPQLVHSVNTLHAISGDFLAAALFRFCFTRKLLILK